VRHYHEANLPLSIPFSTYTLRSSSRFRSEWFGSIAGEWRSRHGSRRNGIVLHFGKACHHCGPLNKDPGRLREKESGGNCPIRKVFIANNGMAATKSIISMRQWATYKELGDQRAITFVAKATPEDMKANAEYIRLADSFVEVPGGSNANNYETGVALGIKFIGPTAPVMRVLGDKIAAKILAQTANVPSIPWSGSFGGDDDGP
jgi:hypothetical protein